MVIVSGQGSTVMDADGTEYLDAMAGLWCVNIGYGRTELADIASEQMKQLSYFPHTAMNFPAAKLAETLNTQMGGGYHLFREFRLRGERSRLQDRAAVRQAGIPPRIPLQDHLALLGLSRHHHGDGSGGRHGRAEDEVRAAGRGLRSRLAALLLSLPVGAEISVLRPGLCEDDRDGDPG